MRALERRAMAVFAGCVGYGRVTASFVAARRGVLWRSWLGMPGRVESGRAVVNPDKGKRREAVMMSDRLPILF